MKRLFVFTVVFAVVAWLGIPAEASITVNSADSLFYMDPIETNFNILDFENLNNVDGSKVAGRPTITVGDTLRGVLNITNSYASGQPDRFLSGFEVTGLFEVMVIGVNPGGGDSAYKLGPSAAFGTTYGAGAMVALFEDHTPDFDPSLGTTALVEATATDSDTGSPYLVLGAAPPATWGGTYYWASVGPDDILQNAASATLFSSVLDVITNNSGVPIFLPKESESAPTGWGALKAGAWPTAGTLAGINNEFSIKGSVAFDGDWTDGAGGNPKDGIVQPGEISGSDFPAYDLVSTDPAQTFATPEPLSAMVWAGLLGVFGWAWYSRRRRSA